MTVFFTSYSAPWPFFLQSILHTIPHTIPHTIYNTISHTIYSTILPTCSPTYAEPCGQSHYEVVQKKYVWTGAVRRCGASSRPRGLGGGPESPQEPQWDTAAATLGSGGEGGEWILDKLGGDTYRYLTDLATYSTKLQYLVLNKAHKYKTTL